MSRILWFIFCFCTLACEVAPPINGPLPDADGDGYSKDVDCNDNDPNIYPGALEKCQLPLIDSNCDGQVGGIDHDQDGVRACDDCDDNNPLIFPAAQEICDDIDNDCDGYIDDQDESLLEGSGTLHFFDGDNDGWGDPSISVRTCGVMPSYVELGDDCDDTNEAIHPEAVEICDFIDNDCDDKIDREDDVIPDDSDPTCYLDDDGDGYGDLEDSGLHTCSCEEGEAQLQGDCNDKDFDIHPDTDFFGFPTPDGHFDYNCDEIEEHHYVDQGLCELDTSGKGCTFTAGWVNGTPKCGGISGIMVDCKYNDSKGTRPASGTGGTGSTGSTSSTTPVCEPEVIREQALCR